MLNINQAVENLTGYIEARVEVIKLDIKDQSTRVGVVIIVWFLVGFFGLMALVFLSIAAALLLGVWLDNLAIGFVLIGGVYVGIAALLLASKNKLVKLVEEQVFLQLPDALPAKTPPSETTT